VANAARHQVAGDAARRQGGEVGLVAEAGGGRHALGLRSHRGASAAWSGALGSEPVPGDDLAGTADPDLSV
jgi:hypothetical protein